MLQNRTSLKTRDDVQNPIFPPSGAIIPRKLEDCNMLGPVDIQLSQTKVQTRCKKAM